MTSPKPFNKPKQYIQGWTEFYKLRFKVTPNVLIPRPETELLVDEVLKYYTLSPTHRSFGSKPYTLLDIGTGSGNIAISITKNLPHIKIIATDISTEALKVAKQNARLHSVENQINFIQSNLLDVFCHSEAKPKNLKINLEILHYVQDDNLIIVANLPYIPSNRIPTLDSSVKDFEPILALDGGKDGFKLYRKLFQQLALHLSGVKLIICEIDHTHGEIALKEAKKYFPEAKIVIKKDLAKKDRILLIKKL